MIEDIDRYLEDGYSPLEAAHDLATHSILKPVKEKPSVSNVRGLVIKFRTGMPEEA
jgi:hypothetical protein